jgi:hypothetical protein
VDRQPARLPRITVAIQTGVMPHPADDPRAALAITRGLQGQLQKARQAGDEATAAAIQATINRAMSIVRRGTAAPQRAPTFGAPPPREPLSSLDEAEEDTGWAEIVVDRRASHHQPRRWR